MKRTEIFVSVAYHANIETMIHHSRSNIAYLGERLLPHWLNAKLLNALKFGPTKGKQKT